MRIRVAKAPELEKDEENMREIVLDTETTGLSPQEGHRIVEIGCLELYNHLPTGRSFHYYLNPQRDMPTEAFNVHGLSDAFLSDKPVFSEIVEEFLNFIAEDTLIIHNASFDMKFLNAELLTHQKSPLPAQRAKCTLQMARKKFPGAGNSLDALCRRFKIDNSNRTLHGALLDSELLADVYIELLGGRQPSFLQEGDSGAKKPSSQSPPNAKNSGDTVLSRPATGFAYRTWPLSQDQEAAHAEAIKMLKNPIWDQYISKDR